MKRCSVGVAAGSAIAMMSASASGQWTVVNLHPAGASDSYAYGVADGQEVGTAKIGGANSAGLWTGSAASWVKFTKGTQGYATRAGLQVGIAEVGGWNHAAKWSTGAGSWVDLHPAGVILSQAHGVDGNQVVGVTAAVNGAPNRAALWNGLVWVDLHPAGATWSWARDVHNGQQVGWTNKGGTDHASLWTGSAASWVDLTPIDATDSFANCVYSGQQGGDAKFEAVWHAGLWRGSAASWVDLHPPGSTESNVGGIFDSIEVGYAKFGGVQRAGIWRGTPESWKDLSQFLAGSWSSSIATDVWHDGNTLFVAGFGHNNATGRDEALLWSRPLPAPCPADLNVDEQVDDADFVLFAAAYNILLCEDPAMAFACPADLNDDGFVDDSDFIEFVAAYNALLCE